MDALKKLESILLTRLDKETWVLVLVLVLVVVVLVVVLVLVLVLVLPLTISVKNVIGNGNDIMDSNGFIFEGNRYDDDDDDDDDDDEFIPGSR